MQVGIVEDNDDFKPSYYRVPNTGGSVKSGLKLSGVKTGISVDAGIDAESGSVVFPGHGRSSGLRHS